MKTPTNGRDPAVDLGDPQEIVEVEVPSFPEEPAPLREPQPRREREPQPV